MPAAGLGRHKKLHAVLIDRTSSRPAFIENDDGRYYLRLACVKILAKSELTDENTIPYTEAYMANTRMSGMIQIPHNIIRYGPLPLASVTRPMEGMQFSDDLDDQHISQLKGNLKKI